MPAIGPIRWRKSGYGTQSVPGSTKAGLNTRYCKIFRRGPDGVARVVDTRLTQTKALEVIKRWESEGAPEYAT